MANIDFTYLYQPPRKYTFEQPQLKEWVEKWCFGKTLNLFGGKTRLKSSENYVEISNDIDPEMPTNYHIEAYEFVTSWKGEPFDTIILDPPYNLRKSREKYEGRYIGSFTKIKDELSKILSKNGRIITLGYDSVAMSASRGFEKIAICLCCHSGDHNDTICVVEQQIGSESINKPKTILGTLFE